MRALSALFVAVATLGTGCAAAQLHRDTLDSRASFDFRCPPEQLKITEIDLHTAGVEGCGQRATYIHNGDTWVMNSPPVDPSEAGTMLAQPPPAGAPPPAPPPPPAAPPPPPPPPAEPPH
ncbi:MAG TPA: hypothetical protein VHW23_34060 [Kofleriaceae bacterium]|jgi:hypothetical protein|nr:hypothetical protein [Kofleriaceae bacterium]